MPMGPPDLLAARRVAAGRSFSSVGKICAVSAHGLADAAGAARQRQLVVADLRQVGFDPEQPDSLRLAVVRLPDARGVADKVELLAARSTSEVQWLAGSR